ncbi:RabGAP/TBC [Sistotremastrum suecicum HHB10207 ss-3]|uniref:RabGAP/TBC n=1 Tax=Sistotremastrum suecicum HHB10207 ss-3 TaxID=1314776 RepID=A0A166J7D3_9AGAM|nr:RabGAP/TBC [Sistotremastrum suecicum HHB10207 ss-3]
MPSTSSSLPTTPPPPPLALKPSPDIVSQEPTDDHTAPSPPKQTDSRHRPQRSIGPSALEKVISKTRPAHLPPKARTEDRKHAADWENMMRQSRLAEQKRQHALHERRLAREAEIEASSEIWSKQILPNWSLTLQNPTLRKLWWKGIPPKLRGPLWENAIGNALALSKDSFRVCLARARRSISSGAFPTHTLQLLEGDIVATLPNLRLFHPVVGPLYSDLKDLLLAWTVARSDEGLGYVVGASKVAAMLLLNVTSNERAFVAMRNLLERGCSRAFYGGSSTKDDVEAYYRCGVWTLISFECRIFDTLLADGMPKVYFNFKQHQIPPSNYLPGWLLPLFIDHLPFEACARVWDVLILEGDSFLFRAALAIMGVIESRLFFPDRDELLSVLRGEHKAALEVAKRSGLTGNGKYEIYGLNEETLWERIDAMDDWWKESTWIRLTQRELPDL